MFNYFLTGENILAEMGVEAQEQAERMKAKVETNGELSAAGAILRQNRKMGLVQEAASGVNHCNSFSFTPLHTPLNESNKLKLLARQRLKAFEAEPAPEQRP